jgi:hypothetical protein
MDSSERILQINKTKLYFMENPTNKKIKNLIRKYTKVWTNHYSKQTSYKFEFKYDVDSIEDVISKFKDYCDICTYFIITNGSVPWELKDKFFDDLVEKEKSEYAENTTVADLLDKLYSYDVSDYDLVHIIKRNKSFKDLLEETVFTEKDFFNSNEYGIKFKNLMTIAEKYHKDYIERERKSMGIKSDVFKRIESRKKQIVENKLLEFAKDLKLRFDIKLEVSCDNKDKITLKF